MSHDSLIVVEHNNKHIKVKFISKKVYSKMLLKLPKCSKTTTAILHTASGQMYVRE